MKGNEKLLQTLNGLLADELTAIMQYMVHSEMCDNWGYARLHQKTEARARQEMQHAEKLIARIIFLEGTPNVGEINEINIGADVAKQLGGDLKAELHAVRMYNDAIHLADKVGDAATRALLEAILHDEDAHVDWLEEQQDQIKQVGIELYLTGQTRE
jgi:bacterioferritin